MRLGNIMWIVVPVVVQVAYPSASSARLNVHCDIIEASGISQALQDLGSILSSTNPQSLRAAPPEKFPPLPPGFVPPPVVGKQGQPVPEARFQPQPQYDYANLAPATGVNEQPLNIGNSASNTVVSAPPVVERQPEIIEERPPRSPAVAGGTPLREPYLSPETQRTMRNIPSDIGAIRSDSPRLVDMQRGMFENIDEDEEPSGPPRAQIEVTDGPPDMDSKPKPRFDISVDDVPTIENEVSMLDKALKALLTGQYEGAVALYKAILVKAPKNRDALFGLATAYHRSGQRQQAKIAYTALLRAYPNYQDGINNFLILASEESPADALKELQALEARNPNFAPIYAQKAIIYNRLNDTQSAIENLKTATRLDPENASYKYNLAAILDKAGQREAAIQLYGQLLDMSYKGVQLPVSRNSIAERLTYLSGRASTTY